ncbi:MAG TPA: TM0106 family RecB-like putative nuclease [Gammaproteobacteria bacterium]
MHTKSNQILLAPTDLSSFLSCRHLSRLDLEAALTGRERPVRYGPVIEELRKRGFEHERRYLDYLRAKGCSIAELTHGGTDDARSGLDRTLAAMKEGVDVIYQPTLADGVWTGRADFLLRTEQGSDLGAWSYEVVDTKLARDTKAGTILQLCVYSYMLERLQGVRPERMHVATPANGFEPISYRLDDYAAYFRLIERDLARFMQAPPETYPELVAQCDYCAWWSECEKRRRGDDHLCYVAGIRTDQIKTLWQNGIVRLAELAQLDNVPTPVHGSRQALERVRDQARMQLKGRHRGAPVYDLKTPFDTDHGFAMLPEPTPDDIFLDIEGSHFAEHGVQEYLTGYVMRGEDGELAYRALWAHTLEEERRAFETFIDAATAARERNPRAHIYHFAPYEPAALKRSMGRFATREVELDRLLRGGAFVDLYAVVRRSLIASVERYSIKDLEPFFGYERGQDLRDASLSRRLIEHALEAGELDATYDEHRRIVERYNREDCESAVRLRDWLEHLRAQALAAGHAIPRPQPRDGQASEAISELDAELQRLRDGLLEGVPLEREERSPEQQARFLLAHLMEFHRREDKAAWWDYFRVLGLEESDYADERRAISGLTFQEVVEAKSAPVQRYRFPGQELDARPGDDVYAGEEKLGKVVAVNYAERTIDIKKRRTTADVHPSAVVLHSRVPNAVLRDSLMRFGETVLEHGLQPRSPYRAALDLLLRRPPPLAHDRGQLQRPGETPVEAAERLVLELDGNVLAIQGPPGTGKTYTGAKMICALRRRGLKVGVTAVSHKVIDNLLEGAMKEAQEQGITLRAVHKCDGEYEGEWGIEYESDYGAIHGGIADGSIDVVGATAWAWARRDFEQSVDVLIVDEAGQMSLSNVLAVAAAGKSLVLLGDPQQLEQPLQSSHPEGSEVSALHHLLGGAETVPPELGLFLDETWRLHPDIAAFTSEVYYEGRLKARLDLEHQAIVPSDAGSRFAGAGLRFVPVEHEGSQSRSAEEVTAIVAIVEELLSGAKWRDRYRQLHPLTEQDILIVAPYNAQVSALIEALPTLRERIGTVDRFQGQEAPVVIYSMTSSSPEDAPRGMEFLYNRNRFNVATSRARALCVLVGNPALFEPVCKTPRQMRMANGFCRYLELATGPLR